MLNSVYSFSIDEGIGEILQNTPLSDLISYINNHKVVQ